MNKYFKLSKNEKQILETMWREGHALSRAEIISLTTNKTWKESSIHILLNQLLKKGAIKIEGFTQTNTNVGRTYIPIKTKEEYDLMQLEDTIVEMDPASSTISNFVHFLVKDDKLDEKDLDELVKILNKKKY